MVENDAAHSFRGASGRAPGPLAVFFTCGVSLETWSEAGILDRELALYERMRDFFPEIVFLTYGGEEDCRIAEERGFRALPKRSRLDPFRYSFIAPWVHREDLRKAAVFKTNQFDGAWAAAEARILLRKPMVARAGYLLSLRAERENWSRKGQCWARNVEKWCCRCASRVVVTTDPMRSELEGRYRLPRRKMLVIPNFVDTGRFFPNGGEPRVPGRVGFVGRLEREKNLDVLIRAVRRLEGVELCIVGEGSLRADLQELATSSEARVRFLGVIPNHELPDFYRSCEVFVLSSSYEGHPKVILEAMACGCPVVGTNVDGIRDVIRDGDTGLLVPLSEEGIAGGIGTLLAGRDLASELGRKAREFAVREFSLDSVAAREIELYRELLNVSGEGEVG
jgi:glycosyltransferase involved in cell wall biosynthesis